jgi:hypothetical protein
MFTSTSLAYLFAFKLVIIHNFKLIPWLKRLFCSSTENKFTLKYFFICTILQYFLINDHKAICCTY